jgi:hypothetical protein
MAAQIDIEPITQHHIERLYKPVGEIVVKWAIIDVAIHNLAREIFSLLGAPNWPSNGPRSSQGVLN